MTQYSKFGQSNPITLDEIDPVDRCIGNTYFNKTGITGNNMQNDFCPRFMAQRCASKWDQYCDIYLNTSKTDMGGYKHINKNFLNETARKKYCRINTDSPMSQCSLRCESFNPTGQSSIEICEPIGTKNWLDTKNEVDLSGNFYQTARLNPISPLYMDKCPETCDAKNINTEDALTNDDMVLNKCIEHGACNNILMDLAYNTVKNNINVTNDAFNKIIEYAKTNRSINPNIVSKLSRQYGISPSETLDILEKSVRQQHYMSNSDKDREQLYKEQIKQYEELEKIVKQQNIDNQYMPSDDNKQNTNLDNSQPVDSDKCVQCSCSDGQQSNDDNIYIANVPNNSNNKEQNTDNFDSQQKFNEPIVSPIKDDEEQTIERYSGNLSEELNTIKHKNNPRHRYTNFILFMLCIIIIMLLTYIFLKKPQQ